MHAVRSPWLAALLLACLVGAGPKGEAPPPVAARGASVSVKVVRDGIGLPGVELAVFPNPRDSPRLVAKDTIATTDDDGVARFEHLPPDVKYALYSPTDPPQDLVVATTLFKAPAEGKNRDLGMIEAVRASTFSGRLVAENGISIPDDTKLFLFRPLAGSLAKATVGPDGAFEFRGLPPEAYRLSVDAEGLVIDGERSQWPLVQRVYAGVRIDESITGVTIPLVPGAPPRFPPADRRFTNKFVDGILVLVDRDGKPVPLRRHRIEGVVVDTEGNPVRGVQVNAWPSGHGTAIGPFPEATGDDGRFSLDSIPDVPIELTASMPNDQTPYVEFSTSAQAPDDGGDVRLVIDPRLFQKQPDLDPASDPAVARQRERDRSGWIFFVLVALWSVSMWGTFRDIVGRMRALPSRSSTSGHHSVTDGAATGTGEGRRDRS